MLFQLVFYLNRLLFQPFVACVPTFWRCIAVIEFKMVINIGLVIGLVMKL